MRCISPGEEVWRIARCGRSVDSGCWIYHPSRGRSLRLPIRRCGGDALSSGSHACRNPGGRGGGKLVASHSPSTGRPWLFPAKNPSVLPVRENCTDKPEPRHSCSLPSPLLFMAHLSRLHRSRPHSGRSPSSLDLLDRMGLVWRSCICADLGGRAPHGFVPGAALIVRWPAAVKHVKGDEVVAICGNGAHDVALPRA